MQIFHIRCTEEVHASREGCHLTALGEQRPQPLQHQGVDRADLGFGRIVASQQLPFIHFIPDLLRAWVPLFLERQCDQILRGPPRSAPTGRGPAGWRPPPRAPCHRAGPARCCARLGFGRIVAKNTEAPNMLVNPV